jgi:pimeloyl-ACP methyl ester carboxylesterase
VTGSLVPIHEWRSRGETLRVPEGDVFVLQSKPDDGTVPVIVLHGFPTSSHDFAPAFSIEKKRRFVTFDCIGFGLSSKPADHGYSLFEQADVAIAAVKRFGVTRAHVWAHDMGTSVATELCARRERGLLPFEMKSLVLMNGSVHIDLAHLTFGQRALKTRLGPLFARLNNERTFAAQMKRVFGKPVAEEDIRAMWELCVRERGTERFPQTIVYTDERKRFARRWIGALERLDVPALVAWGRKDPVAVMAIADALAAEIPRAERETWDELGHYPQVEDPERVMKTLGSFWDRIDLAQVGAK